MLDKLKKNIILYSNSDIPHYAQILETLEKYFNVTDLTTTKDQYSPGMYLAEIADAHLIVSAFNPVILKGNSLGLPNVNIHGAPEWYPGFGGIARALVEKRDRHGVVAHRMTELVDAGQIVDAEYFSIENDDTFQTITSKVFHASLILLERIASTFAMTGDLPNPIGKSWGAERMSFAELNVWIDKLDEKSRLVLKEIYKPWG